jgi:hypothetical protein
MSPDYCFVVYDASKDYLSYFVSYECIYRLFFSLLAVNVCDNCFCLFSVS